EFGAAAARLAYPGTLVHDRMTAPGYLTV
ncbi:MAG: hypothetical protein QOJ93_3010, partial [Actinomycetota bacterium]|nr:hypothetical protein [Actinomycetota bacterium]